MVLALAALYLRFGGLSWMQGAFYGIGAAMIAIIARSAVKLVKMTLAKDRLLWALFTISAVTTAWTESEIAWVFIASGVLALLIKAPPKFGSGSFALAIVPASLLSGLHGPASAATLWNIAWYFAEAGAFVFGSGLAIVPFLYGGVVTKFGRLTERQFLDAVAVAMITPGPVVITVAFIGYLVAGFAGSVWSVSSFISCSACRCRWRDEGSRSRLRGAAAVRGVQIEHARGRRLHFGRSGLLRAGSGRVPWPRSRSTCFAPSSERPVSPYVRCSTPRRPRAPACSIACEGGEITRDGRLAQLRDEPGADFVRALLDDLRAVEAGTVASD
jgi:chromate transport protein ChrA